MNGRAQLQSERFDRRIAKGANERFGPDVLLDREPANPVQIESHELNSITLPLQAYNLGSWFDLANNTMWSACCVKAQAIVCPGNTGIAQDRLALKQREQLEFCGKWFHEEMRGAV